MSKLEMTGISDPGVAREGNEDAYMLLADKGIAILADGMGGHLAGEVASAMAVDIIARHLHTTLCQAPATASDAGTPPEVSALREAIQQANQAIFEASRSKPEYNGMGPPWWSRCFSRICCMSRTSATPASTAFAPGCCNKSPKITPWYRSC